MKTASSMLCVTMRMARVGILPVVHSSKQFTPQRLGAQDVERGERLVQAQELRVHRHGAGKADLLPHPAGQFPRVGRLEAVQADPVEEVQRPGRAERRRDAARLERDVHVLLHGEPREQGEGLEHDGGVGVDPPKRHRPGRARAPPRAAAAR